MDIETVLKMVNEGSTPVIGVVAWIIWKIDKTLNEFIIEMRAKQEQREEKIEAMHSDIKMVIKRLIGEKP